MADIGEYLRLSGVPQAEIGPLSETIDGWDDLLRWLDERNRAERNGPGFRRKPIAPPTYDLSWRGNRHVTADPQADTLWRREPRGWKKVVEYRLRLVLYLAMAPTLLALFVSYNTLSLQGASGGTMALYLMLYGASVYFLSQNFFKVMLGTLYMLRGTEGNPWHPARTAAEPRHEARVAVLYPVYHEDMARVAAGIAATLESIERDRPAYAHHFEFFLLSDSQKAEYWIAEEAAVARLNDAFPHRPVRYRRRTMNTNAKLGNVVDFLRRWGGDYEYMLVMDADSIMDGHTCVELLRMMEGNERLGILQTNPKPVLRATLFGRMEQFGARLFRSVFTLSLQVMYMGNGMYIGHNALIRTKPFIEHCILPTLSGPKPWGGKPLSHDILEGALITRGGYEVWFLPELDGSFEEVPAHILGHLVRERRWMQGNLQHIRFFFLRGIPSLYREIFLSGSMNYAAAPIYAAFLSVSVSVMINFFQSGGTFGNMNEIKGPTMVLLGAMLVFLLLTRFIALGVNLGSKRAVQYGGKDKLAISTVLEFFVSLIYMPMLMLNITYFMFLWATRKSLAWTEQDRGDTELSWAVCVRHFGWVSLVSFTALAIVTYQLALAPANLLLILELMSDGWATPRNMLIGLSPVLVGGTLAVIVVKLTSKTYPALKRLKLFCIPEELDTPRILLRTRDWEDRFAPEIPDAARRMETIAFGLSDPRFYVAHRSGTRARPLVAARLRAKIANGEQLSEKEIILALGERSCFDLLHRRNALRLPG